MEKVLFTKRKELKCDICGKTGFKSKAGLAGHMKIAHGADTRKTVPDELGKRLEALEKNLEKLLDGVTYLGSLAYATSHESDEEGKKLLEKAFDDFDRKAGTKIYRAGKNKR